MKRVLIVIAAATATAVATGAVLAHEKGEGRHAEGAEHKHEKHAERHQRMAERHGEHRHDGGDKAAAPAAQPKAEEPKR